MPRIRPKTTPRKSKLDWEAAPAAVHVKTAKPRLSGKKTAKRQKEVASLGDLLLFGDFVEARKKNPRLSATQFAARKKVASSVVQKSRQRLEEFLQEVLLARTGKLPARPKSDYSDDELGHGVAPLGWQATSNPTPVGEVIAGVAALVRQQFELLKDKGDVTPSQILLIQQEMVARCNALVKEQAVRHDHPLDEEQSHFASPGWQARFKTSPSTSSRLGRRMLRGVK